MMLRKIYFLNWMTEVEEDMTKNCLKGFRLDVRKFTFSNRVVNDWNSLSSQCVNCCTQCILLKYLAAELGPETAKLR